MDKFVPNSGRCSRAYTNDIAVAGGGKRRGDSVAIQVAGE